MIILSLGTEVIALTGVTVLIDQDLPIIRLLTHLTIRLLAQRQEALALQQAVGQRQAEQHRVCILLLLPRLRIHSEAERLPKTCMVLMQKPRLPIL